MRTALIGIAALGACVSAAEASIELVLRWPDGQVGMTYRLPLDGSADADLQFESWWLVHDFLDLSGWWIGDGVSGEQRLPAPDSVVQPDEAHAVMHWNEPHGMPLVADLEIEMVGPPYNPTVRQRLELRSTGPASIPVTAAALLDSNSGVNDDQEYAVGDLSKIMITNEYAIGGFLWQNWADYSAGAFQAAGAPALESLLDDPFPTVLDNSGLPFGPGQPQVALQWSGTAGSDDPFIAVTTWSLFIFPAPSTVAVLAGAILLMPRRRPACAPRAASARERSAR